MATLILKNETWTLEEVVDFIAGTDDHLDPYTVQVMVQSISPDKPFFSWRNEHGEGSGYFVSPKEGETGYKDSYTYPKEG